jgi:hypothetical protein
MSTLLANASLRERYDAVRQDIDDKKDALIASLKSVSGLKDGLEEALATDVTSDPKEFFTALRRLQPEVENGSYETLADLRYGSIFTPKVAEQLKSALFVSDIESYMAIYDRLVTRSTFFRKGAFNHNNASDVAKSLKANGFFKADHSVYVNNKNVRQEIKNEKDLAAIMHCGEQFAVRAAAFA